MQAPRELVEHGANSPLPIDGFTEAFTSNVDVSCLCSEVCKHNTLCSDRCTTEEVSLLKASH